ncbi:MAG: tetratricopeptide repeat protein [Armatimonadetes bacterium]|nr:tetratricopeptide repeat protein [Armatimonadota bacterium]
MSWSLRARWRAHRCYFEALRLLRGGRAGEATKAFNRVVEEFPNHSRAHIQRAKALAAAGRTGEAVRAAKQAADLAPKNHAPLLALGQIHYDAGNLEEARKAFSAAARLDPENRLAQACLGLVLLSRSRIEEGAALLIEHLSYGYDWVESRLIVRAESYLWQHRESARTLEEQLSPDEGGREEGPAGFGLQFASAVRKVVLWPITALRGRAALARLRAEEAFSLRRWEEASGALREAEAAGANSEDVALGLGLALLEARKAQAAAEQFMRLPAEVRQDPEVALLVGAALHDAGRHEEARAPLAIAADRFTKDFVPAYFRGLCDIALGDEASARTWFEQAVARLNPLLAQKRFEEMMRVRGQTSPDGPQPVEKT